MENKLENQSLTEAQALQIYKPQSKQIVKKEEGLFISPFDDELTEKCIMESVGKIKIAFPDLEKEFYFILIERIKGSNFTDKRLIEAINHVIDNCVYPKPTIANFMSYNRLERLLNHDEICKLAHPSYDVFKLHEKIIVEDKMYWYKK